MKSHSRPDLCSCTVAGQSVCFELRNESLEHWNDWKRSGDDITSVWYTSAILLLFSLVILLLMLHFAKEDDADAQINVVLSLMSYKGMMAEKNRERRRKKQAKEKVISWIAKKTSALKDVRSNSSERGSFSSPIKRQRLFSEIESIFKMRRVASALPAIVVTNEDDFPTNSFHRSLSCVGNERRKAFCKSGVTSSVDQNLYLNPWGTYDTS